MARCTRVLFVALLLFPSSRTAAQDAGMEPPAAPTTKVGSLGPDVYLEDLSNTLRLAYNRTITVSRRDPNIAYVGSFDGYIWKTIDGGKTWDESRLIVEPRPFFADSGQRLYFGRHRLAGGPQAPAPAKIKKRLGRPSYIRPRMPTIGGKGIAGGASRGAAANVNFGIGVPGGAPRLQLLVRKFGKPTSGINIKQTLLLRGTRPLEVRIIVIHPRNPKIVFACTMFGLFVTYDGGLTWTRTFLGLSSKGKMTFHVAVDPQDGDKVFLATGEGLYISRDGGQNFSRSTKKGVGEGVIDWIYFNPFDSRYVFVGTDYGLLRSEDGGDNWKWIYFTTFPDGRVVRSIVIDPFDKRTGYIATHDGLYYTSNILTGGLESWQRLGGLKFTGIETSKIAACPKHKGHLWTLTNMKLPKTTLPGKWDTGGAFVYETVDGGKTWKVIFSGTTNGSMQWFESDPRDPDLLWLAWSRALVRMKRRPPGVAAQKKPVYPDDPPIGEVMLAALRYTGVDPGRLLRYRRLSRYKALVPSLQARFIYWRWQDYELIHDGLYPSLPFRRDSGWFTDHKEFRVMALWDLAPLLFNLNQVMFGRVYRLNAEVRAFVTLEVHRFYGELRRLRFLMANDPPKELRIRLAYKLRIQELTSLIDFITGGYLTRWYQGGDRPSGADGKWWERWPSKPER
jgi:photosystem II stability/assembly factor-like uncharacterized protein